MTATSNTTRYVPTVGTLRFIANLPLSIDNDDPSMMIKLKTKTVTANRTGTESDNLTRIFRIFRVVP